VSDNWKDDLTTSNHLFLNFVWPKIATQCGGGEIKPVEIIDDNIIARELDILCGIDIWQTINGAGARGIASRVQDCQATNWRTFTIRYKRDSGAKTEYEKRKEAIETGKYIYPYLTCQAYFDGEKFLGCGVARTVDIFNAIKLDKIKKTSNASFLVIDFDDVKGIKEFKI
jgi:hypothetical protein